MKIAAVLYCEDGFTDGHLEFNGRSSVTFLEERLHELSDISMTAISLPSSYQGNLSSHENVFIRTADDIAFWKDIAVKTGADHCIRIFADAPFAETQIIKEMLDIHLKYSAEFTYSENLPSGLSCEIIACELIKSLPDADEKRLPLAQVIKSNINQFDVELFYKGPDIRDKRIFFRTSNPREKKIMEALYSLEGGVPAYEKLRPLIEKHCEILYLGPSYVELELTGRADITSLYSWRKGIKDLRGDMDIALFKKIISDMKSFGLPYAVCLGGSGDPMMHPSFYEALDLLRAENLIHTVFIETDGINADENFRLYLSRCNDAKIKVIVDMSGYSHETYQALHGSDAFDRILANVQALRSVLGEKSDRLFVQIMKINETEKNIDAYYDFWEAQNIQIILQKQNTCLGEIEDRRYYDLTPLDRVPCWHLQRDLFILADGRIGFCKQDINGTWSNGNSAVSSLSDIWAQRKENFIQDCRGKRSVKPDCAACDEWYTFNM